jgi:hypothetical protein
MALLLGTPCLLWIMFAKENTPAYFDRRKKSFFSLAKDADIHTARKFF